MKTLGAIIMGVLLMPLAVNAEPERAVDPAADRIMEGVCEQLRSAPAYSMRSDISYDDVLKSGLKVQYQRSSKMVLDRPDHLHIDTESDKGPRDIFYNGKTVTVYDPGLNLYSETPAPDSIDAVLDKLLEYGVSLPLDDLMSSEPCAWLYEDVRAGFYGGRHYMDGEYLHHLLFRFDAADFQLWIEAGEVPVLRKVIIEYRDREGMPRYEALLSDWNFRPAVSEDQFAFKPPEGADRIEFRTARSAGEGK